jgi:hypothetical protein
VYKVCINWKLGQDSTEWWDRACVWVIEEFGLPGGCYRTEVSSEYMIFDFDKQEDAALMLLRWGKQ